MNKHKLHSSIKASFLILCILLFVYCKGFVDNKIINNDITSYEIISSFPVNYKMEKGKWDPIYIRSETFVYEKNGWQLYKFNPSYQWETQLPIQESNPWFFRKSGADSGWYIKNFNERNEMSKIYQADSFLIKNGIQSANQPTADFSNLKLVTRLFTKDSQLIESYMYKLKNNTLIPDSVVFYFDKNLMDINYSFSQPLDSIYKMKLFKVKMVFNDSKKNYPKLIAPIGEAFVEIKRHPYKNDLMVDTLFSSFIIKVKENN